MNKKTLIISIICGLLVLSLGVFVVFQPSHLSANAATTEEVDYSRYGEGVNLFNPYIPFSARSASTTTATPMVDNTLRISTPSGSYQRIIYTLSLTIGVSYKFSFLAVNVSGADVPRLIAVDGDARTASSLLASDTTTGQLFQVANLGQYNKTFTANCTKIHFIFFSSFSTAGGQTKDYQKLMLVPSSYTGSYQPYFKINSTEASISIPRDGSEISFPAFGKVQTNADFVLKASTRQTSYGYSLDDARFLATYGKKYLAEIRFATRFVGTTMCLDIFRLGGDPLVWQKINTVAAADYPIDWTYNLNRFDIEFYFNASNIPCFRVWHAYYTIADSPFWDVNVDIYAESLKLSASSITWADFYNRYSYDIYVHAANVNLSAYHVFLPSTVTDSALLDSQNAKYNQGYSAGVSDGQTQATNAWGDFFPSILGSGVNALRTALDIDIFGTNLLVIFGSVAVLLIGILVYKMLKG